MKNLLFLYIILNPFYSFAGTTSDFYSLCKVSLSNTKEHEDMCKKINEKFFLKNKTVDIVPIKPTDVGAPTYPIDSRIQFIVFNDPNYVSGIAYCYFIFRNWISRSQVTPDTFGMVASGFSILNEEIKSYQKWLSNTSEGKSCRNAVEKESEVNVADLEQSLKGAIAIIGLNPFASIKVDNATYESVLSEMKLTINHERIHAFQVMCKEFEDWSMKEWEKLPTANKNQYIKKYNSYNWTVPKIAGREYVAFLFENNPDEVLEHVKKCKIKL